jgi:hypothetical protein
MSITMASVYDGRQLVGHVLHHLDEGTYEAIDTENRSHGTYATYREAAAALPCCSTSDVEETSL